MAQIQTSKTSRFVLIISFLVTLVVLGLFYLGGQVPDAEKLVADASQPKFTDLLLYLCYAMLIITVTVWLIFALVGFFKHLKESPKKAMGGLIAFVALAALLIITYAIGSSKTLIIPGYEGSENTPFFMKLTDMWLYSGYIMFGFTILAMLLMPLFTRKR